MPPTKIQCQNIGCRENYDITEPFCPRCGAPNPRFVLQPTQMLCPICGKVYSVDSPTCPKCLEKSPNPRYRLKPGQTRCPKCQNIFDINRTNCPECGEINLARPKITSLGEATGKKLNTAKIYEILIYVIAGIFVTFGLPFFGLPSLPILGVVLMAIFPFYSFLPSERDAINSTKVGEKSLSAWAASALVLKGSVKLVAFILTVMQFMMIPVSKLIPLAISFVYYFTLPVSYKVTQPFKMIEAWFRIGVGALIAFFIFMAFNGTPQAISLTLMSVAFFCTSFPRHKEAPEEQGVVRVQIMDKRGLRELTGSWAEPFLKIVFLLFMVPALIFSGVGIGFSSIQIIFISVWLLSLFSGLVAGSEGRPAMGILMILMTLFVFTFTATGVMGQAVFGYWWPQVQSTGEAVFGPLGNLWSQVQTSMADTVLLITNPAAYYDIVNKRSQATQSSVTQGGTTKSIELTSTSLFTSVNGELEPRLDPLIGSFEIQNQGEFEANKIKLDLWATWTNPTAASTTTPPTPVPTGTLDNTKFSCSQPFDLATSTSPTAPPTSPAGGGQIGTCNWTQTTYPSEIKVVNFLFNKDSWCLDQTDCAKNNLDNCINYDKSPLPCDDSSGNATYEHAGQTVKVNVNLTYDYNVNVSIPIEVINQDKYRSLLESRQITLQQLTSEYTGGPVKATLWSQKQPVRDSGELSLFVASIVNEGGGILNHIYSFKILIPKEMAEKVETIAQTFNKSAGQGQLPNGCGPLGVISTVTTIQGHDYYVIECEHTQPIKSTEYKRVSFFITPSSVTDRKTSIIIGLANYEYIKTGSTSITVTNAPWH